MKGTGEIKVEKTLNVKVLHVVKTTSQWSTETAVIPKGLLCIEFTGNGETKAKVGDGVKTYAQLPYLSDGSINIADYYTKTETDNKVSSALNEFKASLGQIIRIKGVKTSESDLPSTGNEVGDLWFVGTADETSDSYSEYVWTTANKWEYLGRISTEVDLSGYATITYVDSKLTTVNNRLGALEADKHTHANQSVLDGITASYTTEEKTKLAGLSNYDDTALSARVKTIEDDYIKSTDTLILNCTL